MTRNWKSAASAAAAAAVIVAGSACGGSNAEPRAAAQEDTVPGSSEPTDDESSRTITVSGTGTVDVTPDVASLYMGVQVTAPTGEEAIDRVGQESTTLIEALRGLGIAREDIQTSGLDLYPQYDSNGQRITGYQASTSVTVKAREIDRLGVVIDGVSALVGDELTLGGISFSYDDPESVLAAARAEAVENAEVKAGQYAEVAGADVGAIVRIIEGSGFDAPILYAEERFAADAASGEVAIEPGQQELSVNVTVVFEMS